MKKSFIKTFFIVNDIISLILGSVRVMIQLSESLSTYVRRELKIMDDKRTSFSENELASVSYVSMSKDDMNVIKYFRNLSVLSLEHYPSLSDEDIKYIGEQISSIISLKIKEQNQIYKLDLSSYNNLVNLALIHNENLVQIDGLNKIKRFTFYDNKEFKNVKHIVDYLNKASDCMATLDFLYYVNFKRSNLLEERFSNISWVESLGLRSYSIHEFNNMEIDFIMEFISRIVSKYIYINDTPYEKFAILYRWMIDNIRFLNEDDSGYMSLSNYNNTFKVLNTRCGGRLSYSRTFQMILSYAGIDSFTVYSYGALETIGFFDNQKAFSLLGTSDYSLVRVLLDNKYYYSDITWDSMIDNYKQSDVLRVFLVSKRELLSKHKFVGEGNVIESHSYSNDNILEINQFAKDRIIEVDQLFGEIDTIDSLIFNADIEKSILENILLAKENTNSFKYDGAKERLCLSIDSVESKKRELIKQKRNIISINYGELIDNYLGDNINIMDVQGILDKLLKSYRISKSLYNILSSL